MQKLAFGFSKLPISETPLAPEGSRGTTTANPSISPIVWRNDGGQAQPGELPRLRRGSSHLDHAAQFMPPRLMRRRKRRLQAMVAATPSSGTGPGTGAGGGGVTSVKLTPSRSDIGGTPGVPTARN
jgi:hypothetical protein